MTEIMVLHASSPMRLKKLNESIKELRLPYEGKIREGYSIVYPYKVELWNYKVKEECVPMFLEFLKGNTSEISSSSSKRRPVQMVTNLLLKPLGIFSKIAIVMFLIGRVIKMRRIRNLGVDYKRNHLKTYDMTKVNSGPKIVPGWAYSKVLFGMPDEKNKDGEEEL